LPIKVAPSNPRRIVGRFLFILRLLSVVDEMNGH
jgi:hypothetical protein